MNQDRATEERAERPTPSPSAPEPRVPADEPTPPVSGEGPSAGDAVGKYVYCIVETRSRLDLGPLGIGEGENPVYSVHYGDLAAVVSDTPLRLYDPTRENLLAHEFVNEAVMRDHTVIPMSFGTIFRTEADVVELLRSTGTAFSDVLSTIRGKIELGLKVVWERDGVVAELEATNEGIRGLKEEIASSGKGSTYFARMQLGRLVEAALEDRSNEFISDIYGTLRPLSVATRSNKLIGENMILNAAFLVERAHEQDFDEAVRALSRRHSDLLVFKYTGPWPPYNFVNIKLKLERAD
ncbi:MAG TPA: GvpL/GvpF family gas vesicle protein [Longimicrobiales bacterium]|nr:GvpL/GvpF family gas vesicle protein [Longimicrobiales bacterium]